MRVNILNNFHGDKDREIDTTSEEGRAQAAKLVSELLRSGSAIFLEREIDGETRTYRVTGYDPATDHLTVEMPTAQLAVDARKDEVLAAAPVKRGRGRPRSRNIQAGLPSGAGRTVSVAPVSGGVEDGPSWQAVRYGIGKMCEERGWHHGCPIPSASAPEASLAIARGAPLSEKQISGIFNFGQAEQVEAEPGIEKVNEWTPVVTRVELYRDNGITWKLRWPYVHERLMFWLRTMHVRAGAVDWETEVTAMRALQPRISEGQWESYLLSGCFPEPSQRSPGVVYILRKGLPTLAITERPRPDGRSQVHFLAALCLHPLGYYVNTWAGCQPPTDEVIAHLMLIRTDEHRFWKKSGQHGITDPRAAV